MPHQRDSLENHGTYREGSEIKAPYELSVTDMPPALRVDPWYYSFIELTTREDCPERKKKTSRGHKHRRVRKPLQAIDRPISFLDLGESDARTGEGTPLSGRSAAQSCDLFLHTTPPCSLYLPEYFEGDRLPRYEEVAASPPSTLEENTFRQFTSRYPGGSYHINRASETLQSFHDSKSPPLVVQPTRQIQRTTRPLPPIPSPNQTHLYLTIPIDAPEQSLFIGGLNIAPPQTVSKRKPLLL